MYMAIVAEGGCVKSHKRECKKENVTSQRCQSVSVYPQRNMMSHVPDPPTALLARLSALIFAAILL